MVSEIERIGRNYSANNPVYFNRALAGGQSISPRNSAIHRVPSRNEFSSSNSSSESFTFDAPSGESNPFNVPLSESQRHIEARQGPPEPPDFSALMAGVGGGGSGGGGGGGYSAVQIPVDAGMQHIERAQQRAADSLAALDSQFESRRQMLREEYRLSETDEEKAAIQEQLNHIDSQRQIGTRVIERVYNESIAAGTARSEALREQGVGAGQRTAETFQDAAAGSMEMMSELANMFGGGTGVGSRGLPDSVLAGISDMQRQGAVESAFDNRMFNLTADDILFMSEALRPEMGAQIGSLSRQATELGSARQAQHAAAVQNRIAMERAQWQQALQQLSGLFDQRRGSLEDQIMGMDAQRAQIEADNIRQNAQMRQQARAASAAASRGGGGGGGLSQLQQYEMARQEAAYEQERERYNSNQRMQALRDLGMDPGHAAAAEALGIGQETGGAMLNNILSPDPFAQLLGE